MNSRPDLEDQRRRYYAVAKPLMQELGATISQKYPATQFEIEHFILGPGLTQFSICWTDGPDMRDVQAVLDKYKCDDLWPWPNRFRYCAVCRKTQPELYGQLTCHPERQPRRPRGMIYYGKDYTQEEIEAFRKIQRKHGVSLDRAIQMAEQATKATSSESVP